MKFKSLQKRPNLIFVYTFGLLAFYLFLVGTLLEFFSGLSDSWIITLLCLLVMAYVGSVWLVRALVMMLFYFLRHLSYRDRADIAKRGDLLGRFGLWYLDMQEKLYIQKKSLKEQQKSFSYFVGTLKEPMCVLNHEGKLILWNKAFMNIFGKIDLEQFYWEILRDRDLKSYVQQCLNERDIADKKFLIQGRAFLCGTSFNPDHKEMIILLRDITELYHLDKVKKDLVSNVSHELKTPLTAIKGFTDTLRDMEEDKQKQHYLDVIARHANRLDRIIADLLLLSEVEQDIEVDQQDVDLQELLSFVFEMFAKKAEAKNLQYILDIEGDLPLIKGDVFHLEQAFINLIDNAIKYTEQGQVCVRLIAQSNSVQVDIEDTGLGIPEQDVHRIFERFYMVDKSRSRRVGGTGLGLSIVKTILSRQRAGIELKSELGKGTLIRINFSL